MNVKIQASNKFTLAASFAACVLVLSFSLPWITASFGGYGSISMSWVDYVTSDGSPWAQDVQSLLIVFGAFAALVCAFFVFVQGRRTPAFLGATLLSFVAAAIGSVWLLVQFNQTFGHFEGMSPGLGLWLYLVAASVGTGASFRLLNPASTSLSPHLAGPSTPMPGSPAGNYGTYTPPSAGMPSAPAWATPPYVAPVAPPAWAAQPPVAPPATPAVAPGPTASPPDWSVPFVPAAPVYAAPVAPQVAPSDAPAMKACPNCAGLIDASARFCHFCGSPA